MKRRSNLVLSLFLFLALGTGCTGLMGTPVPTSALSTSTPTLNPLASDPTPVVASNTAENTPTSRPPTPGGELFPPINTSTPLAYNPTDTPSPVPSDTSTVGPSNTPYRRATRTPTITPTPPIPGAGVQFAEPGPMSKVASPLHMIANLRSVPSGTYHVELWVEPLQEGEAPRLVYRDVQRIISNPVDWVYLDQDIQFELDRVSEFGQLRLSVYDTYDRPVSINSVDLVLLSMGPSSITPSNVHSEPIVIRQPTRNALIQGGKLVVSGLVKPSEAFMLVELVAADGSIAGYGQVFVTPAADGGFVPFAVEVPYTVEAGTWVRVEVSESGTRITGVEHLSSVEVYLSP